MGKLFLYIGLCLFLFACADGEKQRKGNAYININKIYKKADVSALYQEKIARFEQSLQMRLAAQQSFLDSLKLDLVLPKHNQVVLAKIYQEQLKLDSLEKLYTKQLRDTTMYYNKQLEAFVNQKVYEYGKDHKYDFIFSPANTNAFMYADSTLDITEKVLNYLDQQVK